MLLVILPITANGNWSLEIFKLAYVSPQKLQTFRLCQRGKQITNQVKSLHRIEDFRLKFEDSILDLLKVEQIVHIALSKVYLTLCNLNIMQCSIPLFVSKFQRCNIILNLPNEENDEIKWCRHRVADHLGVFFGLFGSDLFFDSLFLSKGSQNLVCLIIDEYYQTRLALVNLPLDPNAYILF